MADPWLTIIGIGEDGLAGLPDASRSALDAAQTVFGGPRHLALAKVTDKARPWDVPFSIAPVLERKGQNTAVLASGDPFWHGVGGTLANHLDPSEWRCLPAPSSISLAAARMGWRLEDIETLALHAAPYERLRPILDTGQRILCTLRDAQAPAELADWLTAQGFGASDLTILQALGGPDERVTTTRADAHTPADINTLVMAAITARGDGLGRTPGRPIDAFAHDGQITKSPIRALTLAALAPKAGEHLWDIGAGSGSVSVEWALAAPRATTTAIEPRADRCDNIRENAARFGLAHRITTVEGAAPDALQDLRRPNAVFVGGGADATLMQTLWNTLPQGTRIVANAVTLDTQTLLTQWHAQHGGQLLKLDIALAEPLGRMHGWQAARTQFQWSVTR